MATAPASCGSSTPEAGTLKETSQEPGTENSPASASRCRAVSAPATAHVIPQVSDKGSPALTRYQRVVLSITPR